MPAVSSATLNSDDMIDSDFTNKITITKKSGQSLILDQRRVKIRENRNGLMAISYVAPVFDVMDLEVFFEDVLSSEKLMMDISGTGEFKVSFRGMVEGKNKNFPQNLDHKIILVQEPNCLDSIGNPYLRGSSKFKVREKISD